MSWNGWYAMDPSSLQKPTTSLSYPQAISS